MSQMLDRPHPIMEAVAAANDAVAGVALVDPLFMRVGDQVAALADVAVLESRVADLKARLLVTLDAAGAVVQESGERDLAFWLSHQARTGVRAARDEIAFAHGLTAHPRTAAALRAGEVSPAQAAVVMAAVEALPDDLPSDLAAALGAEDEDGRDVAARAESQLLADAAVFDPGRLRVLGRRILEVVAPEVADEAESRKLEAAERRARERVGLSLRPCGDGTTRISGRVPDLAAQQLSTMLDSLLNPRRTPPWARTVVDTESAADGDGAYAAEGAEDDPPDGAGAAAGPTPWWRLPGRYKLGQAFCELLTRIPADALPVHGGTTTTLVVTVTLDQLRAGLGAAVVLGPRGEDLISVAEARRLACTNDLIPAVLGTRSEVLDLGRTARLFSPAQNRALLLRHPRCQGEGCNQPASHCETHHDRSWLDGGPTDLDNALLLCSRCHHRAHDRDLAYEVTPDGVVVFAPRTTSLSDAEGGDPE
jgi:hypothetical protein